MSKQKYSKPSTQVFDVVQVSGVKTSKNENLSIECQTMFGEIVAVWGNVLNMSNINIVQQQPPPFKMKCKCIKSQYNNQDWWVPENESITIY